MHYEHYTKATLKAEKIPGDDSLKYHSAQQSWAGPIIWNKINPLILGFISDSVVPTLIAIPDAVIWSPTKSGSYTRKSAWNVANSVHYPGFFTKSSSIWTKYLQTCFICGNYVL